MAQRQKGLVGGLAHRFGRPVLLAVPIRMGSVEMVIAADVQFWWMRRYPDTEKLQRSDATDGAAPFHCFHCLGIRTG
ncbi:hypothetical protein MBRU_17170 [Mycolicibacterium brumae DSM 44177]|nr:hypothetical protein MBRU_17170 [Mycolicibacterium brumae DSM 44177]